MKGAEHWSYVRKLESPGGCHNTLICLSGTIIFLLLLNNESLRSKKITTEKAIYPFTQTFNKIRITPVSDFAQTQEL